MTHQPYREWLIDARTGLMTPEQRARLEGHLAACAECRSVRQGVARLDQLFSRPPMVPAPSGFVARFEGRLAARQSRSRWFFGGMALSFGAAGALAAAALVLAPLLAQAGQAATRPGLTAGVLSGAASLTRVSLAVTDALCLGLWVLLKTLSSQPIMAAFALGGLGIVIIWAQLLRRFAPREVL
ncbi:MAG: zf-HC2 domain-containing protein [Chloroflexi bacterium]|nr:zf-HC2 domain-containing protein [Chloroflexota bacterium]